MLYVMLHGAKHIPRVYHHIQNRAWMNCYLELVRSERQVYSVWIITIYTINKIVYFLLNHIMIDFILFMLIELFSVTFTYLYIMIHAYVFKAYSLLLAYTSMLSLIHHIHGTVMISLDQ
jgi:hypothetical protein